MKTIGVLGGFGPQATMDFEARVHRAAQARIPSAGTAGYPPMVVHYQRDPPFVPGETGAPALPLRPDPGFVEAAWRLGGFADFIVITSDFVHHFQRDIERTAGCDVLSMVDLTLEEVADRGWRHIGVLGWGEPVVYTAPLAGIGGDCEVIESPLRDRVDQAIASVVEGRQDEAAAVVVREALEELRSREVDGIILGCTELPLLLAEEALSADLVNPLELLAVAAVELAID